MAKHDSALVHLQRWARAPWTSLVVVQLLVVAAPTCGTLVQLNGNYQQVEAADRACGLVDG
jgi:hypothetical protein